MTTSEEILFKMGLDATSLERGLRETKDKVRDWASDTIKTITASIGGLFAVDQIKESVKGALEFGQSIKVAAKEAGVGVEFIQGFKAACGDLGINAETASDTLNVLARKIGQARTEGGDAAKIFEKWGIGIEGQSQEQIFYQIANMMQKMQDPAQRAALAFDTMGRGASQMAAALPIGADAFKQLVDSAEKLSDAEIDKIEAINVKLEQVGRRWKVFWGQVVGSFVETPASANLKESDILKKAHEIDPRITTFNREGHPGVGLSWMDVDKVRAQAIAILSKDQQAATQAAEATQDEIKLLEKAGKLRDQLATNALTDEEKLTQLQQKAAALNAEAEKRFRQGKPRGQIEVDLAQTQLEIQKELARIQDQQNKANEEAARKAQQDAEKQKELAKETLDMNRRLHDVKQDQQDTLRAPSFWTVQSLAQNPLWFRGGPHGSLIQDNYSRASQQIEFLENRAHTEARYGNRSGADADLERARGLRDWLEKEGVTKPDHSERMARDISDIKAAMTEKGIKIQDDGT